MTALLQPGTLTRLVDAFLAASTHAFGCQSNPLPSKQFWLLCVRIPCRIAATNVFEKQGGVWKLVHHHGSPAPR